MAVKHLKLSTKLSPYAVYEVDGKIVVKEKGKKPVIVKHIREVSKDD